MLREVAAAFGRPHAWLSGFVRKSAMFVAPATY